MMHDDDYDNEKVDDDNDNDDRPYRGVIKMFKENSELADVKYNISEAGVKF